MSCRATTAWRLVAWRLPAEGGRPRSRRRRSTVSRLAVVSRRSREAREEPRGRTGRARRERGNKVETGRPPRSHLAPNDRRGGRADPPRHPPRRIPSARRRRSGLEVAWRHATRRSMARVGVRTPAISRKGIPPLATSRSSAPGTTWGGRQGSSGPTRSIDGRGRGGQPRAGRWRRSHHAGSPRERQARTRSPSSNRTRARLLQNGRNPFSLRSRSDHGPQSPESVGTGSLR